MGAGWGPLLLVSRHWADVGVRVCWEPGAGTGRAMRCLGREDFIDGPTIAGVIYLLPTLCSLHDKKYNYYCIGNNVLFYRSSFFSSSSIINVEMKFINLELYTYRI